MTNENQYSHLDDYTQSLLREAENLVGHADLGFSDMGELEGREEFLRYINKKDEGYKLPFASLSDQFLIAPYEMTLLSGYTGTGKTELVNQILLDCIAQGAKGVITSLELTTNQLKKRLYQQSTGLKTANLKQINAFHDYYAGKLKYWNGKKMQTIEQLLAMMQKFHLEHGCDVFILDNMMMLGARPDEFSKQYETVFLIKEFTKSFPVHVFLVAHPRKPFENYARLEKEKPLYYFDIPTIYDVSGSATIANLVDNYLGLGSNLIKNQAIKEIKAGNLTRAECSQIIENYGDVKLRRGKKREHGENFDLELYFDINYRRYKEKFTGKLKPYLQL